MRVSFFLSCFLPFFPYQSILHEYEYTRTRLEGSEPKHEKRKLKKMKKMKMKD